MNLKPDANVQAYVRSIVAVAITGELVLVDDDGNEIEYDKAMGLVQGLAKRYSWERVQELIEAMPKVKST